MVDPLGDQPARFVQRGVGMVDAIQGRAGPERVGVRVATADQLAVRGHDRTFAAPGNGVGDPNHMTPELRNSRI